MRKYFVVLLVLFVLLISLVTMRIITPVATLSTTSTWHSLISFSGHDSQHTSSFTVPRQWRISWRCTGYDDGVTGSFGASPHTSQGLVPVVASGQCPPGDVGSGHVDETGAGTFWLDVHAAGNWWQATVEIPAGSP